MAGDDATAGDEGVFGTPLRHVRDVVRISAAGFSGAFKKDCKDMGRRVSLLAHLLEEMRDSKKIQVNCEVGSSSFSNSRFTDLCLGLLVAKRLLIGANNFDGSKFSSDGPRKNVLTQFQLVTLKLERSLANLPYDDFEISEEVQEQVELVRSQLRRAKERYGKPPLSTLLDRESSQPPDRERDPFHPSSRLIGSPHDENRNIGHEVGPKVEDVTEDSGPVDHALEEVGPKENLRNSSTVSEITASKDSDCGRTDNSSCKTLEENKKPDTVAIPDDFRCPISLELMRDPVIVASGQTYERSYIQIWIDSGKTSCPKTRQKLQNLTLTPNYVLRSLISQWCVQHNIDQPTSLANRRIRNRDGSFREITGDMAAIEALACRLLSSSVEDCRAAVAEIRSLCKRSTDNRILIADAGAIPILISLLTSEDAQIQDNAVTSILNLSILENNKAIIMLANAIPSIVQVLKGGSTEAKENAAATLFSLSVADENKITIGASGSIPPLVDLLENGSSRGKKDAATALFNLCIYHGNKRRAVRAGIITPLLKMLTDTSTCMGDEALAILSVLAGNHEAKLALVAAPAITVPLFVDVLRTGVPRNKENAAAILFSLCRGDIMNLACLNRLGAAELLTELAGSGTDRARRKAALLLDQLRRTHEQV